MTNLGYGGRDFGTTGGAHDHLHIAVLVDEHRWHHRGQRLLCRLDVIIRTGWYTEVIVLQRNAKIVHNVIEQNAGSFADDTAAETARLVSVRVCNGIFENNFASNI